MDDAIRQHPLATAYNRLTPENVLDAVEGGGRRCTGRFLTLNSYENRVYQLELEDGAWVVGKFYRPGRWSRETILAEHSFLAELGEEEIPVALPIPLEDGSTVGETDGVLFTLFPRVAGRTPQELGDDQVRMVGRLIARIHNVGARREEPHRMRLTPATYGRDELCYLIENDALPPEARDTYAATVLALVDRITPLFADVPVHRLHGDCHLGNLVDTRRGFAFLDFDDMVTGPAAQDVWMLVPSYDEEGARQRHVLIEAYSEMRRFEPRWLALVEPLRALRFVHYSAWIARRWHDPTFQRTFSYFGTLLYWQKEIQDLREQIARIDRTAYL
jgi:Ser/Thr protein kinase RdoA (MazF antagonist)